MPQAVMDPGEVRRFAEELKRFNAELQNRMSLLQARFSALGDTWQDQEHTKFSEDFRETVKRRLPHRAQCGRCGAGSVFLSAR